MNQQQSTASPASLAFEKEVAFAVKTVFVSTKTVLIALINDDMLLRGRLRPPRRVYPRGHAMALRVPRPCSTTTAFEFTSNVKFKFYFSIQTFKTLSKIKLTVDVKQECKKRNNLLHGG